MTRFRRLTEFTVELTKWARVLGNEALVAVREVQWTRKKKLLATGIGCCGLLVSGATWYAFQGLEDGFQNSEPSLLPPDQVSPLTKIDESTTHHAPLQTPPVRDNSLSPALHLGEPGAPSQIEQISNSRLVQTAEVVQTAGQTHAAWLLGTIETVEESPTFYEQAPQPAVEVQPHGLPPANSANYNQPLLVVPEGP